MGLLNSDKAVVGFDLRMRDAQISYSFSESGNVETLSMSPGTEQFNIPLTLCKRKDTGQWLYGAEAANCQGQQGCIVINNLYELAIQGEVLEIDGEKIDPVALLALFVNKCLSRLTQVASVKKITAMMLTCPEINSRTLEVLRLVVRELPVNVNRVYFQAHAESFYEYVIHQPKEMWAFQAMLFEYEGNQIKVYTMKCNKRTKPVVAYIEEKTVDFYKVTELSDNESIREREKKELDEGFLRIATDICSNNLISSIYLIGEGFEQDWLKESLKYLCRGRRVFQGNNLYSKGACLAIQEKMSPTDISDNYIFLGEDKLKANVGMKLLRQGEETYYALLDAGVNWYDADKHLDIYMKDDNEVILNITPLNGRNGKVAQIALEDFPEGISRIGLHLYMATDQVLTVELEDLGFGEFRPATGHVWKENIAIY